jgi:chromosome segregation ATPase
MIRTEQIQADLLASLASQERTLQEDARRAKARLDDQIAEIDQAKKELPQLREKLTAKQSLSERLAVEIVQLEERIAIADMRASDERRGAMSIVARTKADSEHAQYLADSFVADKIKQITGN